MAKLIPLPRRETAPAESLRDLLGAVQSGDPVAQGRLYDRYAESVNKHVWRLLGGDVDHDDIVQNIFVAVFRRIDTVREPDALGGWIRSITVFEVRTHLRRRTTFRRFFSRSQPDIADHTASRRGDPEAAELLSRMQRVLREMAADDRLCFVLRHVEKHEVQEVADLLSMSLSTTKRRLRRAEERFRKRVERDPFLREFVLPNEEDPS